jgi:hypothetical protein
MRAGDVETLQQVLTPGAVTRWPQSGEQVTGATSCIRIFTTYPGGPPAVRVDRVLGAGDVWVAELTTDYGSERWYLTVVAELEGGLIARLTEWFAPQLPAPEWRRDLVDPAAEAG